MVSKSFRCVNKNSSANKNIGKNNMIKPNKSINIPNAYNGKELIAEMCLKINFIIYRYYWWHINEKITGRDILEKLVLYG
jgi:hypothetical protein